MSSLSSLLNRISNGFVFEDKFDKTELNTDIWQVSPSDHSRYSLTEKPGFLRLKHGDPDLFILMNTPRYDFVMEVDTKYVPVRPSDQGGIVAYLDNETYIEMLEYYDPKTGTTFAFDRLRMVKRGDLYEGYGSNNNGAMWELIGTAFMIAPKIGISLHGIQESSSDNLDIDGVRLYRDTKVQVGNLNPGQTVKLLSHTNVIVGTAVCPIDQDYAKIDAQNVNFPFKGKVQIFDTTGFLLDETEVFDDIWGGDVFWYGVKLDFEIDGLLMRQDREHQLGNMESGIIERKGYVINNNDIPIYNIRASVMALSEYHGWEWTDIATDMFGEPGIYGDVINLGHLEPGERVPIWMKITRQPSQQVASLHDYKFRVLFESG